MIRRCLFAPLALIAVAAAGARQATPTFGDVASNVRNQCSKGEFSGVVLVVQRGRTLWHVACQPPGSPKIDETTRFKFFSMSKMFTGLAMARLVEQGRVDPAAPIGKYLPELPAGWRDIRVVNLLNHTSGVPDLTNGLLDAFRAGAPDHRTAMDRVLAKAAKENPPLASPPGTKWAYNNFGYELLARIGDAATGETFDRVLRRLVLDPAGMRTTAISMPRFVGGKLEGSQPVARLVPGFNGKPGALEPATSYSFVQLGAGAVIGSEEDMVAFDRALARSKIIRPATAVRLAQSAFPANDKVSYGYGMMYRKSGGCAVLQHSGGTNGYISDFARIPERDAAVIVLSNFSFVNVTALRTQLVDRITAAQPCGGS